MEIDLPGRFRADAYKGDYRMALYEHTVMTRQDISAQQAEALNDTIKDLIVQGGGSYQAQTLSGDTLTFRMAGEDIVIVDGAGDTSRVTMADLNQANGMMHVIDKVLLPAQ